MKKEQLTELIVKVQNGDSEAANELFSEIYNDVYFFAFKTVKDSHLAEDITQEAMIAIFKNINDLKDPVAFPAWSRQVTYSRCTRYFRKTHDVLLEENEDGSSAFDILEEDNSEFIPHEALDQKDLQKTISSFIDTLSPEQRSAVMLYYFDELSVAKIAEIQGVTEGCVKSRLNYARKSIRSEVEAYEKKTGIRLHALPFLPFIKWIYTPEKATLSVSSAAMESASVAALSSGAASSAGGALTAAGVAAKATGIPLVAKIGAGVIAAAIAVAAPIVFMGGDDNKNEEKKENLRVEAAVPNKPHINVPQKPQMPEEAARYIEKTVDNVTYVRRNPSLPEESGASYNTINGQETVQLSNDYWIACPGPEGCEPMEDIRSITILSEIDGIPVDSIFGDFSVVFPNLEELVLRCVSIGRNGGGFANCKETLKRLVVGKEVLYFSAMSFWDFSRLSDITVERNDERPWNTDYRFYNTAFWNNEENWTVITDENGNESRLLICSGILLEASFDGEKQYIPEGVYAASSDCQRSFYISSTLYIPSTFVRGLEHLLPDPEITDNPGRTGGIVISPDNPYYYVEDGVFKQGDGEVVKSHWRMNLESASGLIQEETEKNSEN